MMTSLPRVTLLVVLSLFPASVLALPVAGLYEYEVAVSGQGDAERARAFRVALEAVIVKVTGERRWLSDPAVAQALNAAQSYVEEIGYRRETLAEPRLPEANATDAALVGPPRGVLPTQSYLIVRFARDLVDRMLTSAGIPIWDSNRPSVLVWMVIQEENGARRYLSADVDSDIVGQLQRFARERGVPIIFPVLDFEDRRAVSADQLWALDAAAVAAASQRYRADSVLMGRLLVTGSGDLVGVWQFLFRDQVLSFDGVDTDLAAYLAQPLDEVTRRLAEHFAIVRRQASGQQVRLEIQSVRDLGDWSDLMAYLQGLSVVDSAYPRALQQDTILLDLSLSGSAGQLVELLTLDRALLPLGEGELNTDSAPLLQYRWTR